MAASAMQQVHPLKVPVSLLYFFFLIFLFFLSCLFSLCVCLSHVATLSRPFTLSLTPLFNKPLALTLLCVTCSLSSLSSLAEPATGTHFAVFYLFTVCILHGLLLFLLYEFVFSFLSNIKNWALTNSSCRDMKPGEKVKWTNHNRKTTKKITKKSNMTLQKNCASLSTECKATKIVK